MMASRHDIESARLSMLEARKALEDYETLKGFASSCEHTRLTRVFTKATADLPKAFSEPTMNQGYGAAASTAGISSSRMIEWWTGLDG